MAFSRDTLTAFLHDRFGLDPADLSDDTRLFEAGLLDSFSMIELIMFVEEHAGIRFDPTEVRLDNLGSIGAILLYVAQRPGGGG